jgi:cytochrome c oxidase assembly protein subunit 15
VRPLHVLDYDRPVPAVARFAWLVLAYNIGVILWGAYVRASGSGAGCGAHWPLCNGEVIPRSPSVETLIEYSHRLTSGLALIAVVWMLAWTRRVVPAGHPARRGAWLSVFFIFTEAAVGAGLVLFELVADNATMARAMFMAVHLVNTFFLIGALTLTAWWLSGGSDVSVRAQPGRAAIWAGLVAGLLLSGMSGAVAALGDTLYPAATHAEGLAQTLSPTSHVLLRLRALHPLIAVVAGVLLMFVAPRLAGERDDEGQRVGRAVLVLAAVQMLGGILNVLLLAPVWMQMVHLLVADVLWIAFVLLGARVLARPEPVPTGPRISTL